MEATDPAFEMESLFFGLALFRLLKYMYVECVRFNEYLSIFKRSGGSYLVQKESS